MSEWISVNERIPEFGKRVIVFNDEGVGMGERVEAEGDDCDFMGYDEGWFCDRGGYPGRSFGEMSYRDPASGQPTHWMPLPEPPSNQ